MTLLLTVIAAIISTVVWYRQAPQDDMQVSTCQGRVQFDPFGRLKVTQ